MDDPAGIDPSPRRDRLAAIQSLASLTRFAACSDPPTFSIRDGPVQPFPESNGDRADKGLRRLTGPLRACPADIGWSRGLAFEIPWLLPFLPVESLAPRS